MTEIGALLCRYGRRLPSPMRDVVAMAHGVGRPKVSVRDMERDGRLKMKRARIAGMLKRGERLLRRLAALTLTVAPEGEAAFDVDAEQFIFANREGLTPEEREIIRTLRPGESITLGGGAAPYFTVSRRS